MLGQSAPIQGCMVARVARIRGNRLQVVAAELPENLSCVAICVCVGSPALLVIGLRPTLRTGFCEALVLGLKRFVGRSWVQNVTVKTAFRSHWLRVGVRSSLLHQKCGRATARSVGYTGLILRETQLQLPVTASNKSTQHTYHTLRCRGPLRSHTPLYRGVRKGKTRDFATVSFRE